MSRGGKKQTVGYWYRLLHHFGFCKGPVDAFLEFRAGDRTAWKGVLRQSGRIAINKPNLWGGEKSEGGLVGELDIMMGEPTQQPNDYLAGQLGAEQPAYRGKLSAVWRGGRWGAMNPYPKNTAAKMRRVLKGWDNDEPWYPEKAEIILVPAKPLALYFAIDLSTSMNELTSNGETRLENEKAAISACLDAINTQVVTAGGDVDIMIVGWGSAPTSRQSIVRRSAGATDIDALKAWVNSRTAIYGTYFPAGLIDMAGFYADARPDAARLAFFVTDGEPSNTGYTPEEIAASAAAIVTSQPLVAVHAINIDIADTTYTSMVDNTPGDEVPVVMGGDPAALTSAILEALGGLICMNPIHILYDSLTASDMQGEPVGMISDASFRAAADKCHAEHLGLCAKFLGDDIGEFQQRICDIIGGNLTQSQADGLYYVDLIRGDHSLEDLPVVTADDIVEFSYEPSVITEQVNQVTVDWFDPQSKQERSTAPLQALGAIQAAGRVIPETRSYPEIAAEFLALLLGARDLQAMATPTARFRLTLNRRQFDLRPGLPFRLQYPAEGISDMVCVLGDLDTGTLTDGRLRIVAVQDVFSFPSSVYVDAQPGLAQPPSNVPVASPHQLLLESPYVELVTNMSHADLAAFPEDAGILLTIAARAQDGLNYSIHSAAEGEDYADNGSAEWCPTAQIVEAADYLDTEFTLSASMDLDDVEVGSWALWDEEIVRVDVLDVDAGAITLARGCADTAPALHVAGSRIYFCGDWAGTDGREYVDGDTVRAKLLSRTSTDLQSLAGALEHTISMAQRQFRPYPPGRLRINGAGYPGEVLGDAEVEFAHRDRTQQADKLFDATVADIGPEPGTTYELEVIDQADDSLTYTEAGITTSPVVIPSASLPYQSLLRLWAVRDGLRSWQAACAAFQHGAAPWTPALLLVPPKIWLDDGSPITEIAGACSSWDDRSANGWHFSQTNSSLRPAVVAGGLNGRRVIRFDGTDDVLLNTSTGARSIMSNTGAGWAFVVGNTRAVGAASQQVLLFPISTNVGTNRFGLFAAYSTGSPRIVMASRLADGGSAHEMIASASPGFGSWSMQLFERDWSGGRAAIWLDGEKSNETTGLATGSTSSGASNTAVYLGTNGPSASAPWRGDLAVLIVGSGSLPSVADIDRLFGWAAWRYGLVDELPVGHPYKLSAPTV